MQCTDTPDEVIEEIGAFPSSAELDHMSVSLSQASQQYCKDWHLGTPPPCWELYPKNKWASISFSLKLLSKLRVTLISLSL
jgi:hypothetical protein